MNQTKESAVEFELVINSHCALEAFDLLNQNKNITRITSGNIFRIQDRTPLIDTLCLN